MAGPDNLEPVTASWQPADAKDIPVKASPPREKSPTVSEVKEGAAGGDGEGGAMPTSSSVTPPDGGWGWAVVFASFMIHIIADGITYSFGVFLVELIDVFQSDRGETSLIISILVGVTLGSGPIASYFTNRYGCRLVTIGGAILAAAGMALSVAATSIVVLYFTIGVLTGLGFGLIYLPAIVSVSIYFEKKRAFATGIAVCGSGLGTFIFAPLTKVLITELGWKGAMLVISVMILAIIMFGCLMRPLDTAASPDQEAAPEEKEQLTGPATVSKEGDTNGLPPPPELLLNGGSVAPMKPFSQQMGVADKYEGVAADAARMAMSHPAMLDHADRPHVQFGSVAQFKESKRGYGTQVNLEVMGRKDIFYSGSLLNLPEYRKDPEKYRRSMLDCKETSLARIPEADPSCSCCGLEVNSEKAVILLKMMDFSLFKDPIFMMFATSNFLTSIGFNVPYVFTVDRAEAWGISPSSAAFLLSVIGISNTVARLCLGWLSDRPWINRLYLYNVCLVICGLSMGLSVFMDTYTTQAVYCAIFGATSGAYVGLTSVVLVDLLGLDKLTNAFGLLLMFQGIASVIGPPIIGALKDSIGDYDAGFYFAGSMIFLSGAMLFAIPPIQRKVLNKKPSFKIHSGGQGDDDLLTES